MGYLPEIEKYRRKIEYCQRIRGSTIKKHGLDPRTITKEQEEKVERVLNPPRYTVEIRTDPLLGDSPLYTTLISEERALRPGLKKPLEQAVTSAEGCIFCEPSLFENGSLPFIFHEDGAVTFANQYPTVIPHYVTVFTKNHAPDLNDIGEDDLKGYFSSGRDIALLLKKEGHSGMWDFINWGLGAGGTQPHPHAQRGALHKLATTHADQEWQSIKRHRIVLNKDPFQWYFDSIRDSNLFIYENDTVFIAASFAPRFPDQVDVYMKRDVCHFGELFPDEAKVLATDVSRLFRGLRNLSYAVGGKTLSKEIRNLNFITHQSRFNHDGQYRLHWHIYPRESLIGGTELSGLYASATYPENVTMSLRPYFL